MSEQGRRTPPLVADRRYPAKGSNVSRGSGSKAKPRRATGKGGSVKRGGGSGRPPGGGGRGPTRKGGRGPRRNPIVAFFSGTLRFILKLLWRVVWRVTAVIVLLVAASALYVTTTLPEASALVDGRARGSVTMLDREGSVFAWRGEQFGGAVDAATVSRHLRNAVVATEDKRFYQHFGVSPRGIAGAIRINLREGRGPLSGHGGSTITQQTAKLMCLGVEYDPDEWKNQREYEADCRETSLWRKMKEAVYAIAMEIKYSKDEILTIYLNRAYMGGGAYGAEAAAQRFFGKSAREVDPAEGAMLAGLLTAPTTYAPTNNLERAQDRADVVLALMEEQGYLTDDEALYAEQHPAQLSEAAEAKSGGYFADWVMSTGPDFFTRDTTADVIIRTTLDQRIQRAAEGAMKAVFEDKVKDSSKAQAAVVVMSADGAVRAMVGGRKTGVSGVFNRATQARRQTGSAFKPFVYATALELGRSPLDTVVDEPITIDIPGSGPWTPKNYTGKHYGRVTLAEALKNSLNIPAIKVSENVGRENVRQVANGFGLKSDLAEGPALALGASESTLIEMTGAYAGILNGGSSVTPYGLVDLRLQGDEEPLMDKDGGIGERVIREDAARQLIWMMEKVVSEGTGHRARLSDRQAAGKTGTTQAARDAWFVGFTADYVAGVWMGYDDNTPLTGVTGGGLPAEIWHEVMTRVNEGVPVRPLPMDPPVPPTQPQPEEDDVVNSVVNKVRNSIWGAGASEGMESR
ncbi:PBP1A family penicillin-binding protein [Aquicoccus sp. SCR17]|nr:PBP1A family penicillin-binding protein [Carideicomes alvinocaridis]